MARGKQIFLGILSSALLIGFAFIFFNVTTIFPLAAENLDEGTQHVLYIMGVFGMILGAINLLFAITASFAKPIAIIYVIYSILLTIGTVGLGFLSIFSASMAKKFTSSGYNYRESRRYTRPARVRKEKEIKRKPSSFVRNLRRRKVKQIIKQFFLLALTMVFSVPAINLFFEKMTGENYWELFVFFGVYLLAAAFYLVIKGIPLGYGTYYTVTTTTSTYEYRDNDSTLFVPIDTSEWVETDRRTKSQDKTAIIISPMALLFLVISPIWFIFQFVALLVTIFVPSGAKNIVAADVTEDIPSDCLRCPRWIAKFTALFFGFVLVNRTYLDYMYTLVINHEYAKRRKNFTK